MQTRNKVFNHPRVIFIHAFLPARNHLPVSSGLPATKLIYFISASFPALIFRKCGQISWSSDPMWWLGGIAKQCRHGWPSSSHWDQPHTEFCRCMYLLKKALRNGVFDKCSSASWAEFIKKHGNLANLTWWSEKYMAATTHQPKRI